MIRNRVVIWILEHGVECRRLGIWSEVPEVRHAELSPRELAVWS